MTVTVKVKKGQKPTPEQIREINNAKNISPVYDDEAPALTSEQLNRYRKAAVSKRNMNPVTIELSDTDYETAKAFGTSYRAVLSDILSLAMKDPTLISRFTTR